MLVGEGLVGDIAGVISGGPIRLAWDATCTSISSPDFLSIVHRSLLRPTARHPDQAGDRPGELDWGAPIPIVYCSVHGEPPVPAERLSVRLPEMVDCRPDGSGRSPLARAASGVQPTCPSRGGPAQRETDTIGGFARSSWYFLRFTIPDVQEGPCWPERLRYRMPVDSTSGAPSTRCCTTPGCCLLPSRSRR